MIRPGPDIVKGVSRLPQAKEAATGEGSSSNAAVPGVVRADAASLDRCLEKLTDGRDRLSRMDVAQRIALLEQCVDGICSVAPEWVDVVCESKGIARGSRERAQEILGGPAATLRQLQLFLRSMRQIDRRGRPKLPAKPVRKSDGRIGVRMTPCPGFFDPVTFIGFRATTWLQPDIGEDNLDDSLATAYRNLEQTGTSLVLGAGNVSGIPAADMLTKLCVDNRAVLLKMNPVNECVGPIFERAFAPLVENDLLRIISGDVSIGASAVADERVDDIHITGSEATHDAIVWGPQGSEREERRRRDEPIIDKPVGSELGNVTPWVVVPGAYPKTQLKFQAENIVTSMTNNAAFNCVATRVIVTWKQWPERERFLQRIENALARVPQRVAYYPGAEQRFEQYSGLTADKAQQLLRTTADGGVSGSQTCPGGMTTFVAGTNQEDGTLPWTLVRNVKPDEHSPLFGSESFVCVCAEVLIDATSPEEFLRKATEFCNEKLWGTLAASITVPSRFKRKQATRQVLDECVDRLRYGVVAQNQWSGVVFALMSPPWGGHPSSTRQDIQSGTGWVHNSFMLTGIEKTVLEAPLVVLPKAVWLASHPSPESVAWSLCRLFQNPSLWNLSTLGYHAFKGGLV
ncbi:MAG: acyl-CoA reductase-like NAD-dependent aldehyde dehydrogenase [Planctomycetaceae bacterium]|jgi:acyl-CoA reductase-like NAD-dependent aldehyde dehydrogenase